METPDACDTDGIIDGFRCSGISPQRGSEQTRLSRRFATIPLPQSAGSCPQCILRSDSIDRNGDGDTIEVNNVPIRLAALDCPERGTRDGDYASLIAKQFQGQQATCELTGAKTYERLVGYCSINGADFGRYMMNNSSCKVWEKYDVWDRY
jgi:endonuclease YncB( thermonuclease family)